MEKNEVGCVVVCLQNTTLEFVRFSLPKKFRKFSAIKDFFEFTNLFRIGVCNAEFACPLKIQKGRREENERGMDCEVND